MATDITQQIMDAITSYSKEVAEKVKPVARKTASKCAKQLNQAAAESFDSAEYAKSWKSKMDSYGGYVVYSKIPGLPHLLENGHEVVSHGRVVGHYNGKKHIQPVAEEMVEEYESEVRRALEK